MPKAPHTEDSFASDDELGIGKASLEDMLANPAFAKLIDAAVAARIAQGAGAPVDGNPDLQRLVTSMERMFQVQASQMPGYQKPISADEMERRLSGKVEMEALLQQYTASGTVPSYVLGDKFYAGDVLYDEGREIRTLLPPAEHFQPTNDAGRNVYAAMMQWIGGTTLSIGEQVEQAMQAAKAAVPFVTGIPSAVPLSPVQVVMDSPRRDVKPKRVAGTIVPETHGVSMPSMPATAAQPLGPIFVGS